MLTAIEESLKYSVESVTDETIFESALKSRSEIQADDSNDSLLHFERLYEDLLVEPSQKDKIAEYLKRYILSTIDLSRFLIFVTGGIYTHSTFLLFIHIFFCDIY